MARDILSRQSHRYMLKQLIELNDKKWSVCCDARIFRKGISIINLSIRDLARLCGMFAKDRHRNK